MKKPDKSMQLGDMGSLGVMKFGSVGMDQYAPPPPTGDPYENIEYTGDPEKDTKAELNEYERQSREGLRKYNQTLEGIFDSEYYLCICFADRRSKEEFLEEFDFIELGNKYINGEKLKKRLRKLLSSR